MKSKRLKLFPVLICGGVIGLVACLQWLETRSSHLRFFHRVEWMTYDWRMREALHYRPPTTNIFGFVQIGDDAIAIFSEGKLGTNHQFGITWPRHVYGRIVRELNNQGAKAVGLDVMFGELRPDHPPIQTAAGPISSDHFFEQQLRQAGNVVLAAAKTVVPVEVFRTNAFASGDISNERDADGVLRRVKPFHDYRIWHPLIRSEARLANWNLAKAIVRSNEIVFPGPRGGLATLSLTADGLFDPTELSTIPPGKGFVRLQPAYEEARVWHMGIVLGARELDLDLNNARVELKQNRIVLTGRNGVTRIIPVNAAGELLIDWTLRFTDDRLMTETFESVFAKDIERSLGTNVAPRFRDKLVVVGSTATGNDLTDYGATPLEKETFLTSSHWNVANSVILGRFIQLSRPWIDLLLVGLMGLSGALFTWKLRALWASMGVGILLTGYVALAMYLFITQRFWLPMVMPVASLLLVHFALLTYRVIFEQNEQRRIKTVFAKIVSPNVVHELLKAEKLSLIGARRKVTVFFADVRGFTEMTDISHARAEEYVRQHKMSEKEAEAYFDRQSQEVLQTVNLYLGLIADIIKKHEGTLDKYIGDCVMAFWGAPTPNDKHASACVRTAIESQCAIDTLNQERAAENKRREADNARRAAQGLSALPLLNILSLGTGINTGMVTVGLMGSDAHIVNYTVFGRDVNLASRLEALSGRGRIVIGEGTYQELLKSEPALAAACMELHSTTPKGFRTPVKIYEVPWKPERHDTSESKQAPTEMAS